MSRIFDAVSRSGRAPAALQSLLAEQEQQQPANSAAYADIDEIVPVIASEAQPVAPAAAIEADPQASPSPESCIRTLALDIQGGAPLLPFDDGHWVASEQYRIIRTKILQHPRQARVILITSSSPLDGKSFTAVNLAGALALKNESKTLLIDGDLRRGALHASLGIPSAPGLRDVLQGACSLEQAIIRTEQLPNLYVLPCGDSKRHASELLDSTNWRSTMRSIHESFAHVVLDSPPLAAVADYDLLAEAAEGIVLVVRPDHSNRKLFLQALKSIPKQKLLGVVLNCAPDWFLARPYGYGNGYYSS